MGISPKLTGDSGLRGIAIGRAVPVMGVLLSLLAGCASLPPSRTGDVCSVFREKDGWYADAKQAYRRWGAPIPLQMAIINQESSFIDDARPPRLHFLGIPLWRSSSAYGYGQAQDGTWDWYRESTGNGGADRDDFEDTTDFVAWYIHQTSNMLGLPKNDAYNQYLAYHEGQGGYRRGSWRGKSWLQKLARRVAAQTKRYQEQLKGCQRELELATAD